MNYDNNQLQTQTLEYATLILGGSSSDDNTIGAIRESFTGKRLNVVKNGPGRWILSGSSNYRGSTTVNQGDLIVGVTAVGAGTDGGLGGNSAAPIIIGDVAGTGTASLLLQKDVTVGHERLLTLPSGSQLTVLGGVNTSGSSFFGAEIQVSRDVRLQAANSGKVEFYGVWGFPNGSAITVGSPGNEGTVVISNTLSTSGPVNVNFGTLRVDYSSLNTSSVTVDSGAKISGSGRIKASVGGDGLITPGGSAILRVDGQIINTANTSFSFEFTSASSPTWSNSWASVNDVLRSTNATPFQSPLVSTNIVNVYFNVTSMINGDTFRGGFYSDKTNVELNFASSIGSPKYSFFVYGDGGGSINYNGKNYYTLNQYMAKNPSLTGIATSVVTVPTANYADGTITNGQITQFTVN